MSILNQIDLTKLFDPGLIFETTPLPGGLYLLSLIIYSMLLASAVVLGVIGRRNRGSVYKKIWRQLIYLFLVVGLIGPVLVFFRWQSIPYLGSRLLVLLLWACALAWVIQIIFYRFFTLPKEIKKQKTINDFEKYLPRGDKRSVGKDI